ncbi:MAG: TetR/AcrR family transcriptional regulator [Anaerolineae bacterium]|nr:TetR/AcrR family transcriptional regulator [Anaerolineae bacterium]
MQRSSLTSARERKKQQRKERIYRAALRLFREKGFDNTTVEEITEAAGVAKGTFFNYFPTKEAVLLYLGEQQLGGLHALANMQGDNSDSAAERIKRLLGALAESAEKDRDLMRLMVSRALRAADLVPSGRSRFGIRAIIALLVARGQRAGEFRSDIPADRIAGFIEAIYFHELFQWCDSPIPYALAQRLETSVDLLITGLGPHPQPPYPET